jgi:hypothetical protein
MGADVESLGAAAVSGWVVLWSLKQDIEQLRARVSRGLGSCERRGRDGLWERADWTFVFLGLGVADAAEGICHVWRRNEI